MLLHIAREKERGGKGHYGEIKRKANGNDGKIGNDQEENNKEKQDQNDFFQKIGEKGFQGKFFPEGGFEAFAHLKAQDKSGGKEEKLEGFRALDIQNVPAERADQVTETHEGDIGFDIIFGKNVIKKVTYEKEGKKQF